MFWFLLKINKNFVDYIWRHLHISVTILTVTHANLMEYVWSKEVLTSVRKYETHFLPHTLVTQVTQLSRWLNKWLNIPEWLCYMYIFWLVIFVFIANTSYQSLYFHSQWILIFRTGASEEQGEWCGASGWPVCADSELYQQSGTWARPCNWCCP